jgi:superfamily II DNA or RNA helicase
LPFRQLESTTSAREILGANADPNKLKGYEKAKAEKVPLIIFGTYDSAERIIQAGIPVYMTMCDEAQYLVSEEFGWIGDESEEDGKEFFPSYRKYYFTATLKETYSGRNLGMNNSNKFGSIIYAKTPLEMIKAGEILRPRIHFVDVENKSDERSFSKIDIDVNAIQDAFIKHKMMCTNGAKLLVITGGSDDLNKYVIHPKMKKFLALRDNLKIFDISSAFQPRINGDKVSREQFLEELQNMGDRDDAIIFHINILSEGIDVPGITGIMPMNNMTIGKFLQTLGRASRLNKDDRTQLYSGSMKYDQLENFKKPYAWIIIPSYGIIGDDLRERIQGTVEALRQTGFNASEDVMITNNHGTTKKLEKEGIDGRDHLGTVRKLFDIFVSIEHIIEEKEIADIRDLEEFKENNYLKSLTFEKSLELF